jgi:hypothetical protein
MKSLVGAFAAGAALFAFAWSATAGAASITSSSGVLAPVLSVLTATSSNTQVTSTKIGTVKCANVSLQARIAENSGLGFQAFSSGEGTTKECNVIVSDPTLLSVISNTSGQGQISLIIKMVLLGTPCQFSSTSLPFTYAVGSSSIHIGGFLVASPSSCGAHALISGDFKLEIGGAPVILD